MPDAEKVLHDVTYRKWDTGSRVACILAPMVLAFGFEREMAAIFGPEGALLMLIGGQMLGVIFLPERAAKFMADRAVKDAKAHGELPQEPPANRAPSAPAPNDWANHTYIRLKNDYGLWIRRADGRAWARGFSTLAPVPADPADVQRFWTAYDLAAAITDIAPDVKSKLIDNLYLLFALTILNHRRESTTFRELPPDRLISMLELRATVAAGES